MPSQKSIYRGQFEILIECFGLCFSRVEDKNFLTQRVTEDISQDVEEDSAHFVAVLLECLAILNKLPDTVEVR